MSSSSPETFLYFAFASHLLEERMRVHNPTAEFITIGRLDDYSIEFDYRSGRWHGALANITKSPGNHVWGVVWSMNVSNLPDLEKQKGVDRGIYEPIEVDVHTKDGGVMRCRSYNLLKRGYKDKLPSPQYLDVLLRGAMQHDLPEYYVERLRAVQHNEYDGLVNVLNETSDSLSKKE